jgi:hypothetical protein
MQTKASNFQRKHELYDEPLCELNAHEGHELSEEILAAVVGEISGGSLATGFGKFALTEFGKTSIAATVGLATGIGTNFASEYIKKALHH